MTTKHSWTNADGLALGGGPRIPETVSGEKAIEKEVGLTNGQVAALDGLGDEFELARLLSQSGIPMILPSSGTIGANGALSGITAIADIFTPQYCYMHFPAGAVYAGAAAGLYLVLMATSTTGTVYNNIYLAGRPSVPTTPTPVASAAIGAYATQTGVDIPLLTLPLDPGALGPNGALLCHLRWTLQNSVGSKIIKAKIASNDSWSNATGPLTTSGLYEHFVAVGNRGVADRQQGNRNNNAGLSGGATGTANNTVVDTAQATNFTLNVQLSAATDFIGLSWHSIELRPAA